MRIKLLTLYPDRMSIYADRGNIAFLRRRCEWRGIEFEEESAGTGEIIDPDRVDMIYIGGGQDRDQRAVAEDLASYKCEALGAALEASKPLLAVCGGYQLMGESYEVEGERLPGLGLAEIRTRREPGPRLVGNIAVEAAAGFGSPFAPSLRPRLAGFENHGGRTELGRDARPLGRVLTGHGNNGRDRTEGVIAGSLIGTYLHGPLLPKNWWLADHLIASALSVRLGREVELDPLEDRLERAANASAFRAAAG